MDAYFDAWGQLDSVQPGLRGVNLGKPWLPVSVHILCIDPPRNVRSETQAAITRIIGRRVGGTKNQYNIEAFWLTDDTFTTNRKYVERFCDVLERSGLDLLWGDVPPAPISSQSI